MSEQPTTGGAGAPGAPGAQPEEPEPGYEQARDELVEVVRRLEAGGTTLEEALALWERGEQLADVCDRHLTGARRRLDEAVARREAGAGGATDGG